MRLIDVPNGSIFRLHDDLVLKTEYFSRVDDVYIPDCYIIGTGEKFWGGMKTKDDFKTKFNDFEVEVINVLPDVSDTSSDTISRQAAIDALDFEIVHMTAYCDGKNEGNPFAQYNKGLEDGKKAIEALPPAQPEPHEGHWIRTDCGLDVECKCSRCGYKDFVEPGDEYWFKRNYCPNCGAKMKGERQK